MKADYAAALEKFWRIAQLKKELERRPPIRRAAPARAASRHVADNAARTVPAPRYVPAPLTAQAFSVEEAKLRRVEESIRVFVRVADPKVRQIVPMRYFNLMLNPAEVAAYTADHLEQTGPRGDAARLLLRVVAVTARITTEVEELKRSQKSPSVWNLHASSLMVLVNLAQRVVEALERLALAIGQQPETAPTGEPLRSSLEKLRQRAAEAESMLAEA